MQYHLFDLFHCTFLIKPASNLALEAKTVIIIRYNLLRTTAKKKNRKIRQSVIDIGRVVEPVLSRSAYKWVQKSSSQGI